MPTRGGRRRLNNRAWTPAKLNRLPSLATSPAPVNALPPAESESLAGVTIMIDDDRLVPPDASGWLVARSAERGLALLGDYRQQPIRELWLDYNLGYRLPTAADIVKHLIEAATSTEPYTIERICVHTSSETRAQQIITRLNQSGYHTKRTFLPNNRVWDFGRSRCPECRIAGEQAGNEFESGRTLMICDNGHKWDY